MRFSPAVVPSAEKEINKLRARIRKIDQEKEDLEQKIAYIEAGQSPIKPGMWIEWESGHGESVRTRTGKVVSVECSYRGGFEYRCILITKNGMGIGYAKVGSDRMPTIVRK